MKKLYFFIVIVTCFSIVTLFSERTFAQRVRLACTDSDRSYSHRNEPLTQRSDIYRKGRTQGNVADRNQRGSRFDSCLEDGRLKEYYCSPRAAQIQEETLSCPEGQTCNSGKCVVSLNACGTPDGGWLEGKTYLLSDDIVIPQEGFDFFHCFSLNGIRNLILDCNNHTIRLEGDLHFGAGITILNGQNVTVKNCILEGFITGIQSLYGPHEPNATRPQNILITGNRIRQNMVGIATSGVVNERIINNAINENEIGISIESQTINEIVDSYIMRGNGIDRNNQSGVVLYDFNESEWNLTLENNFICDTRDEVDFDCQSWMRGSPPRGSLVGSGNQIRNVGEICGRFLTNAHYSPCQ